MKISIINDAPCERMISIEIPWEELDLKIIEIAKKFRKIAKIDGFRPGKVPLNYIRKIFAKDIQSEVFSELVQPLITNYINDHNLRIVRNPILTDFIYVEKCPLTARVSFEFLPEITLKNYKGIEVLKEKIMVDEKEIDERILEYRKAEAQLIPVQSKEAQDGDFVIAELITLNFYDERGKNSYEISFILGSPEINEAINNALKGMKINEEKKFDLYFYNRTENEEIKILTKVILKEIKEISLPPIDEVMKSLGVERIENLRKHIYQEILKEKEQEQASIIKRKIIEKIRDDNDFQIPVSLLREQLDGIIRRKIKNLREKGFDVYPLFINYKYLEEKYKDEALNLVKEALILEEIAKLENITMSEEEVKDKIEELAKEKAINPLLLKAMLEKEGEYKYLLKNWLYQKVIDFLYKHAIIKK